MNDLCDARQRHHETRTLLARWLLGWLVRSEVLFLLCPPLGRIFSSFEPLGRSGSWNIAPLQIRGEITRSLWDESLLLAFYLLWIGSATFLLIYFYCIQISRRLINQWHFLLFSSGREAIAEWRRSCAMLTSFGSGETEELEIARFWDQWSEISKHKSSMKCLNFWNFVFLTKNINLLNLYKWSQMQKNDDSSQNARISPID